MRFTWISTMTTLAILVEGNVELSLVSNVYLPYGKSGEPQYGTEPVTRLAYSPDEKFIYAAGKGELHILDVTNPASPTLVDTRVESSKDFDDVYVCADRLFVTVGDKETRDQGQLRVYTLYNQGFQLMYLTKVGGNPGKIAVTSDCNTAVIALPGKSYSDSTGERMDPLGEILVAVFQAGALSNSSGEVTRIDFSSYDDRYASLEKEGVRFVSKDEGGVFSRDMEPEAIVLDEDFLGTTAYVTLQENNAIAEIDLSLSRPTLTTIHGLHSKIWGNIATSDKETGERMHQWPIRAWFQPSGIHTVQWQSTTLLITANQGGSRKGEATRGITSDDLSYNAPQRLKTAVDADSELGRLKLSSKDGKDPATGKYKELYAFGGRSYSIWSVQWGLFQRLYDSGSQMEEIIAQRCPHLFNMKNRLNDRSDDKGPEPESLTAGVVDGRLYMFIGIKYPGIIFVYSVGNNPSRPRFETVFCDGIPSDGKSFETLFKERRYYAADPQDIRFLSAADSPSNKPILIVAGAASGTVTLLEVNV